MFTSTPADRVTLRNNVIHPDLLMSVSTSALEVQKILAKLDANKATEADNIPARILKGKNVLGSFRTYSLLYLICLLDWAWFHKNGKELILRLSLSLITKIRLRIIGRSSCCLFSASARRRSYITLFFHM